jgi:hypothetical protein
MTRFPRCQAGWCYTAALFLSFFFFSPAPCSTAGENSPFAGLSDHLLIPENPYLFVNSVTLWNGYRSEHLETGAGAGNFDLYELGLEADLHWDRLHAIGSMSWGWDSGQDAESADFLAGFGYDFDLTVTGIQLTPLAGWASSHLDRDAWYESEWEGPFLGARLEVPLAEKWMLLASYSYRWAAFEADLPSGVNRADAGGHTGRLDLIYQLNQRIDLRLGTEIQSFSSELGSFSHTAADWESWSVRVGVSAKF